MEEKKMKNVEFYICEVCGNIITYVENAGVPVHCCGRPMKKLTPNTTDAAQEKHVPQVIVDGNKVHVNVGSVTHPMSAEHSITWVCIQTSRGVKLNYLSHDGRPETCFTLCDGEKLIATYAYCNLHGLWMAEA